MAPNARFTLCWAWRDHPAQSSPSRPFEVAASSPSHRRPRPLPGVAAEPGEAQEPPPVLSNKSSSTLKRPRGSRSSAFRRAVTGRRRSLLRRCRSPSHPASRSTDRPSPDGNARHGSALTWRHNRGVFAEAVVVGTPRVRCRGNGRCHSAKIASASQNLNDLKDAALANTK